jgi:cation transport ATPase
VEALSSHPLASAVVAYARLHGVEASKDTSGFEILPGEGVTAVVKGRRVHVGNGRTAERLGWSGGEALLLGALVAHLVKTGRFEILLVGSSTEF